MWELFDIENNLLGCFDWVIFSIPAPQIKEIAGVEIFKHYNSCKNIKMSGCYTLMLGFNDALNLDWGTALIHNADISWILSCTGRFYMYTYSTV